MTQTQQGNQADALGGFEERLDPKKLEFGEGEVFTGILTNVERVMVGSPVPKPAIRYTFLDFETNESYFLIGTYQIDSKIRKSDLGHVVIIRYEGADQSVSRNGNSMKKFSVQVSKRTAPGWASDGTPITDSDLPAEAFMA